MRITTADIARVTGGKLYGQPDLEVAALVTDSRQISYTGGVMFIAIAGKNHDGHKFIGHLYRSGIRIFLTERMSREYGELEGAAFIVTQSSVEALQKAAAYKRSLFRGRVVAVTGSAGKTVVKEWLADILSSIVPVVRSPRSYNSQTGVPLSVWKLDEKSRMGIFEAGISHPGEMEKLQAVIKPDIGIITNIGEAHSENFKGLYEKAAEKLRLFESSKVIIYCRDYEPIREAVERDAYREDRKIVAWSFVSDESAILLRRAGSDESSVTLAMNSSGKDLIFRVPFTDRASVENAATVIVAALEIGVPPESVAHAVAQLTPVAMRMEKRAGINNCLIIEDYYNSDPGSLGVAIEYLMMQSGTARTLILSDFVQTGRDERELYGEIAALVHKTGVTRFIGIGEALLRNRDMFVAGSEFWRTTDEFTRSFSSGDYRNEVILIKGARIFGFEKIAQLLAQQVHQTQLEINLDAISSNINEFRRHLRPGTQIMAMVKAFAYGAGPAETAALMEYHRINYLAVAYADEGADLREAGVSIPVMVMNPDPGSADLLIRYNLEPEIFSFSSLSRFIHAASRHGAGDYPVHIKIDSGMHRLGFLPGETGELARMLSEQGCLRVRSVFSHLAASDDSSMDDFTHRQAAIFIEACKTIREGLGYDFLRHLLNSAGIFRFPEYQFDMVRPGIAIYGIGTFNGVDLKPAGRFVSRISQIKKVPAGEPVGYNCTDISDKEREIAIVAAGYADGLNRRMGNRRGSLLIRGRRVPVIGNVCMDMCMADVTGIGAAEGDEAEIFGHGIPIGELASVCGTIPYEILTSVPSRVKRVFYRE